MELLDLGKSFALSLRAEGKSPKTVQTYLNGVRAYCVWLQAQGRPATTENLTREDIRAWLAEGADRLKPATMDTRFSGLHRFCGWLVAEDELAGESPMKGIARPPIPPTPVPLLSDEDLAALIKACQGKTFQHRRDEALIRALLDCGVRVSELVGWGNDEVDLDNGCVLVTGKGNKKRMVYFGTRTARALDRYKRMRTRHRWAHSDAFWLGQRGPLRDDGIRQALEMRATKAGLVDPANPHRFRHTFAHDFLLAGGDRGDLKRLAGWTSDVMLERYGASGADHRAMLAAKKLRRGDRV